MERTFRDYLLCGDISAGFVRVRCKKCSHERKVAFSCKRRGFCPSCCGRTMADTAAHLVDFVLPEVGVRQYVLSLPFALRYRLAYNSALLTPVLNAFLAAVFASLRRRARTRYGTRRVQCGAVTFVQRFGGALNLNVHFHTLVLEGVYITPPHSDGVRFLRLPSPTQKDVELVLGDAASRIERCLSNLDAGKDDAESDPLVAANPALAELYANSLQGVVGTGSARRALARKRGTPPSQSVATDLCAAGFGMSLHAGVFVPARDRKRLEHVCRYVARPPLATARLAHRDDGSILYELRHRWRDGTTHIILEPAEMMARLAALVPPPRSHQVRYHGILAPNAAWRDHVVPATSHGRSSGRYRRDRVSRPAGSSTKRYAWALLLRRVFACDALVCPKCSGRMRIMPQSEWRDDRIGGLGGLSAPRPPPAVI